MFCAGQDADWESRDVESIEAYAMCGNLDVDDAVSFDFDQGLVITKGNIFGFG